MQPRRREVPREVYRPKKVGNIVKDPEGWNDQKLGLEETSYTKAEKVLLLALKTGNV